ncbi:hypothetical protein D9615_009244 [Tricholomella constricta]|uniref:DUF6699 domain-containing protein n=1 Tax=Tricholomella constricta TaxID=117010 RepID=A0A8H5LWN8_9AGAR|nr:hypothetical protein D9615_009244 [Tricholomella constricta]
MYNDMPPAVDPDSVLSSGGGGFIPPPPGAAHGGQPYNPFPGATSANSGWSSAPAAPWSAHTPQSHPWLAAQQAYQYPPGTSQPASYGYPAQYPAFSPYSAYNPSTPAGSWGAATPAHSWGPSTPASAGPLTHNSPYVHQQQQTLGAPESTFGQPITASPWFNGGVTLGGDAGQGYPAFGGSSPGGGLLRRPSAQRKPQVPHEYEPTSYDLLRTSSRETPAFGYSGGLPLRRSASSGANGRRSRKSSGNLQPFDLQQQLKGEEYTPHNLARRPLDWRSDYDPRGRLKSLVVKHRSDVRDWNDPQKRILHELLAYKQPQPPVSVDLRYDPSRSLHFPLLRRGHNQLDFAQLATQPAAQGMRLFHPNLPWYIDVVERHENGITVQDVIWEMFWQLNVPIQGRHWYNEELDSSLHEKMNHEFQVRTALAPEEAAQGVKRVDFLKGKIIFNGLVKARNGLWEIKTSRLEE